MPAHHGDVPCDEFLDILQVGSFLRFTERDGDAAGACTAGTADTVHIVVRVMRHIVVEHVRQVLDVGLDELVQREKVASSSLLSASQPSSLTPAGA